MQMAAISSDTCNSIKIDPIFEFVVTDPFESAAGYRREQIATEPTDWRSRCIPATKGSRIFFPSAVTKLAGQRIEQQEKSRSVHPR